MKLLNLINVMDWNICISIVVSSKGKPISRVNMKTRQFDRIESTPLGKEHITTPKDLVFNRKIYNIISGKDLVTWSVSFLKNFKNFKDDESLNEKYPYYHGKVVLITVSL